MQLTTARLVLMFSQRSVAASFYRLIITATTSVATPANLWPSVWLRVTSGNTPLVLVQHHVSHVDGNRFDIYHHYCKQVAYKCLLEPVQGKTNSHLTVWLLYNPCFIVVLAHQSKCEDSDWTGWSGKEITSWLQSTGIVFPNVTVM